MQRASEASAKQGAGQAVFARPPVVTMEAARPVHKLVYARNTVWLPSQPHALVVSSNQRHSDQSARPTVSPRPSIASCQSVKHEDEDDEATHDVVVSADVQNYEAADVRRRRVQERRRSMIHWLLVVMALLSVAWSRWQQAPATARHGDTGWATMGNDVPVDQSAASSVPLPTCDLNTSAIHQLTSTAGIPVLPDIRRSVTGRSTSGPEPSSGDRVNYWTSRFTWKKDKAKPDPYYICCVVHHFYQSLWLPICNYIGLADMITRIGKVRVLSCVLVVKTPPGVFQCGLPFLRRKTMIPDW